MHPPKKLLSAKQKPTQLNNADLFLQFSDRPKTTFSLCRTATSSQSNTKRRDQNYTRSQMSSQLSSRNYVPCTPISVDTQKSSDQRESSIPTQFITCQKPFFLSSRRDFNSDQKSFQTERRYTSHELQDSSNQKPNTVDSAKYYISRSRFIPALAPELMMKEKSNIKAGGDGRYNEFLSVLERRKVFGVKSLFNPDQLTHYERISSKNEFILQFDPFRNDSWKYKSNEDKDEFYKLLNRQKEGKQNGDEEYFFDTALQNVSNYSRANQSKTNFKVLYENKLKEAKLLINTNQQYKNTQLQTLLTFLLQQDAIKQQNKQLSQKNLLEEQINNQKEKQSQPPNNNKNHNVNAQQEFKMEVIDSILEISTSKKEESNGHNKSQNLSSKRDSFSTHPRKSISQRGSNSQLFQHRQLECEDKHEFTLDKLQSEYLLELKLQEQKDQESKMDNSNENNNNNVEENNKCEEQGIQVNQIIDHSIQKLNKYSQILTDFKQKLPFKTQREKVNKQKNNKVVFSNIKNAVNDLNLDDGLLKIAPLLPKNQLDHQQRSSNQEQLEEKKRQEQLNVVNINKQVESLPNEIQKYQQEDQFIKKIIKQIISLIQEDNVTTYSSINLNEVADVQRIIDQRHSILKDLKKIIIDSLNSILQIKKELSVSNKKKEKKIKEESNSNHVPFKQNQILLLKKQKSLKQISIQQNIKQIQQQGKHQKSKSVCQSTQLNSSREQQQQQQQQEISLTTSRKQLNEQISLGYKDYFQSFAKIHQPKKNKCAQKSLPTSLFITANFTAQPFLKKKNKESKEQKEQKQVDPENQRNDQTQFPSSQNEVQLFSAEASSSEINNRVLKYNQLKELTNLKKQIQFFNIDDYLKETKNGKYQTLKEMLQQQHQLKKETAEKECSNNNENNESSSQQSDNQQIVNDPEVPIDVSIISIDQATSRQDVIIDGDSTTTDRKINKEPSSKRLTSMNSISLSSRPQTQEIIFRREINNPTSPMKEYLNNFQQEPISNQVKSNSENKKNDSKQISELDSINQQYSYHDLSMEESSDQEEDDDDVYDISSKNDIWNQSNQETINNFLMMNNTQDALMGSMKQSGIKSQRNSTNKRQSQISTIEQFKDKTRQSISLKQSEENKLQGMMEQMQRLQRAGTVNVQSSYPEGNTKGKLTKMKSDIQRQLSSNLGSSKNTNIKISQQSSFVKNDSEKSEEKSDKGIKIMSSSKVTIVQQEIKNSLLSQQEVQERIQKLQAQDTPSSSPQKQNDTNQSLQKGKSYLKLQKNSLVIAEEVFEEEDEENNHSNNINKQLDHNLFENNNSVSRKGSQQSPNKIDDNQNISNKKDSKENSIITPNNELNGKKIDHEEYEYEEEDDDYDESDIEVQIEKVKDRIIQADHLKIKDKQETNKNKSSFSKGKLDKINSVSKSLKLFNKKQNTLQAQKSETLLNNQTSINDKDTQEISNNGNFMHQVHTKKIQPKQKPQPQPVFSFPDIEKMIRDKFKHNETDLTVGFSGTVLTRLIQESFSELDDQAILKREQGAFPKRKGEQKSSNRLEEVQQMASDQLEEQKQIQLIQMQSNMFTRNQSQQMKSLKSIKSNNGNKKQAMQQYLSQYRLNDDMSLAEKRNILEDLVTLLEEHANIFEDQNFNLLLYRQIKVEIQFIQSGEQLLYQELLEKKSPLSNLLDVISRIGVTLQQNPESKNRLKFSDNIEVPKQPNWMKHLQEGEEFDEELYKLIQKLMRENEDKDLEAQRRKFFKVQTFNLEKNVQQIQGVGPVVNDILQIGIEEQQQSNIKQEQKEKNSQHKKGMNYRIIMPGQISNEELRMIKKLQLFKEKLKVAVPLMDKAQKNYLTTARQMLSLRTSSIVEDALKE